MLDHLTKFVTIVSEKRGVHHLFKSSAKLRFSIIAKCLFSKTLFFSEIFSSVESCDDIFDTITIFLLGLQLQCQLSGFQLLINISER